MTAARSLVVVSAGLSQPSTTRMLGERLARSARDELEGRGLRAEIRVVDLRLHAHDVTNHVLAGFASPQLREVIDAVEGADGLIAVTPIFNASYSGLFKSFVDVLDPASLDDKPVLLAATGGSARHSLALEHALRPLFAHLRTATVRTSVFAATQDWAADEPEGELRARIDRAGRELAELVAARDAVTIADPFALRTTFEELLATD